MSCEIGSSGNFSVLVAKCLLRKRKEILC